MRDHLRKSHWTKSHDGKAEVSGLLRVTCDIFGFGAMMSLLSMLNGFELDTNWQY